MLALKRAAQGAFETSRTGSSQETSLRTARNSDELCRRRFQGRMRAVIMALALPAVLVGVIPSAHAVDGCELLLCLAGNWKLIPVCVPTVRQALHDVARGRPFPTCSMAGAGNTATHRWTTQTTCPTFYSTYDASLGSWAGCVYSAVISVEVNNAPWADVFWSMSGDTSTRYYNAARAQLGGSIDPTYDRDAAGPALPAMSPGSTGPGS